MRRFVFSLVVLIVLAVAGTTFAGSPSAVSPAEHTGPIWPAAQ